MSIGRDTLLFFDAASLLAAAGSPGGGSGFLLSLVDRNLLKAVVSPGVLIEAARNVRNKMGPLQIATFHRLIVLTPVSITPFPSAATQDLYKGKINDKDIHVVAAAIAADAEFLITLDQRLINETNRADLPISVLTPAQFITTQLSQHPEYPFP